MVPDDLFLKAEPGFGQASADGSRWITIFPHGHDEKGQPVKIRESKNEPGTWHVIAGAGGSLSYLRLTGVKSPAEYREQAKARREAKKAKAEHQREFETERRSMMTEDERQIEAEHERQRQEAAQQAALELRTHQQEFIAEVAKHAGWQDDEWQFEGTAQKLKESGASPERVQKLEEAHHKTVYRKALDVVQQSRRQILADQDRARVILGDTPLTTDDPNTVALTDLLDTPATPSGKGFQSITKTSSDEEIRAALVASDKVRLRDELETARAELLAAQQGDVDGAVSPDLAAQVAELKGDLHTAELLELATAMTSEQIKARRKEIADASAGVRKEQADYGPRLTSLRESLRGSGPTLTPKARVELDALEARAATDQRRIAHLREQDLDMAVVAGETVQPAVAGEQKRISARRQTDREAEIRAEHGAGGVASYRAMLAKLREGGERYRAEIRHYKETGVLVKPTLEAAPIVDAEKALELLARAKGLKRLERDIQSGEESPDFDGKMYGKGYFTETGQATPAMREAAQRDIRNAVLEQKTRAFLERVESPELLLGRGGVFTEDYDQRTLHRALERHLSAGAYNALNNAALAATKSPVLSREVVDTLGAAGAAQLLAHVIAEHETPATLREMAKGVGEYHVSANVEQSEERLRESEEALDRADEAMAAVTSPADLAVALEANTQRATALEEARQALGQALGEYEATAALAAALSEGTRDKIDVTLGPIGTETAVRQLRSLGLARSDYEVTSDGTNYFATIKASGFSKLAQPVDTARAQLVDDIVAIKKGDQDDPNWQPKGTIVRPKGSLTAPGLEPAPLTHDLKPLGNFGDTGDPTGDVRANIALRAANGDDPNDILADLHGAMAQIPAAHRQAVEAEINRVFPLSRPLVEHGKPVFQRDQSGALRLDAAGKPLPKMVPTKAEEHVVAVRQLTRDYLKAQGVDRGLDINTQAIDGDDPTTHEAFTQALARDPRAMVAFKAIGELADQDQRVLRHFFATDVAKADAKTGFDKAATDRALAELGPEPTKETKGLFGGAEQTPEWRDWSRRRQVILANAHDGGDPESPSTTSWPEYVAAMGGTGKAYEALQDRLKSGFLKELHRAYTTLHNQPLRIGTLPITHAELHAGYLDPVTRTAQLEKRRELIDEARTRAAGKYAEGSALEKMERLAQEAEIGRQNQMGLLGGTTDATKREPKPTERYTLGQVAEGQISTLMRSMARNWKPGEPVKLLANKQWADGPGEPARFIHQQRTIKAFERGKRLAAALGTGSGKTSIGIAALTDLRAQPNTGVTRGLYVVPSSVQGQFAGEFTRFVKPGALNWAANPGGDHAQRLAEHQQGDTHAVVHTHQAFRDDMLHLVADQWGLTPEKARDKFMGLSRKEAAETVRAAWRTNGIDYQMLMVDEGHGLLDRQGKPDSLLSRIAQAVSDNTPYYMSASADPIKNDHTELRSLLDKLEPSGKYSDAGEWNRRYGINTTAAAEALKREVAPYVYAAQIRSGNQVNMRRETVPLSDTQSTQYEAVLGAFQRLRAARERGEVDIEAAKQLAPKRFTTASVEQHEAIARQLQRNPGTLKEQALARIIDMAPREGNAKIQKLVALLKEHPVKERPVVIFAHNLSAVRGITEGLAEAGHRVVSLTGADSAKERDRKRLMFQPESGEPKADVFILSDAGQVGLNLQRGQTLIQYDRPLTSMSHAQRNGRIDRLGQQNAIDLIDLMTDSPYEARAQKRIETKYALRNILTDPAELIDDTGLAATFRDARRNAAQGREQVAA